jgi:hypothetical protein
VRSALGTRFVKHGDVEIDAHAEEAERMVEECHMPEARRIYEDIARKYREMADEAERIND